MCIYVYILINKYTYTAFYIKKLQRYVQNRKRTCWFLINKLHRSVDANIFRETLDEIIN